MADPVIRLRNGLLLFKLQTAEGVPAVPSALTDAIAFEENSASYNSPYKTEDVSEITGSAVASAPLILGQPSTLAFRSRLRGVGAGLTYSSTVKPPLHQVLQACGMRGQFTAAIAAAPITAGGVAHAVLGTGFNATLHAYRGMPLLLTGGQGAGRIPLVISYSDTKIATLAETMPGTLDTAVSAALPANWTYAGTTPADNAARLTDQPCGTAYYYEDGVLYMWTDCRGSVDFDGNASKPGFGGFSFTGIYAGRIDAAVPSNAIVATHSPPLLVQGAGLGPVAMVSRKPLPISQWAIAATSTIENPDDPNTPLGFQGGQIGARAPALTLDPLATLVAVRDTITEIGAGTRYSAALKFGSVFGNAIGLTMPIVQPVESTPGARGQFRSEGNRYRCLSVDRDAYARDGDRVICFY